MDRSFSGRDTGRTAEGQTKQPRRVVESGTGREGRERRGSKRNQEAGRGGARAVGEGGRRAREARDGNDAAGQATAAPRGREREATNVGDLAEVGESLGVFRASEAADRAREPKEGAMMSVSCSRLAEADESGRGNVDAPARGCRWWCSTRGCLDLVSGRGEVRWKRREETREGGGARRSASRTQNDEDLSSQPRRERRARQRQQTLASEGGDPLLPPACPALPARQRSSASRAASSSSPRRRISNPAPPAPDSISPRHPAAGRARFGAEKRRAEAQARGACGRTDVDLGHVGEKGVGLGGWGGRGEVGWGFAGSAAVDFRPQASRAFFALRTAGLAVHVSGTGPGVVPDQRPCASRGGWTCWLASLSRGSWTDSSS